MVNGSSRQTLLGSVTPSYLLDVNDVSGVTYKDTTNKHSLDNSDWQTHLFYFSAQHWSPPGLCAQPCPIDTAHPCDDDVWDCTPRHQEGAIVKCTTPPSSTTLQTSICERSYKEEINCLTEWCTENNLLCNVSKTNLSRGD